MRSTGVWAGVALGMLVIASSTNAGTGAPAYWDIRDVASNDMLNVRAAAGPDAKLVGQIAPTGTCLRNLGCQGGQDRGHPRWCRVERSGLVGWVAARYLRESAQPCP